MRDVLKDLFGNEAEDCITVSMPLDGWKVVLEALSIAEHELPAKELSFIGTAYAIRRQVHEHGTQ